MLSRSYDNSRILSPYHHPFNFCISLLLIITGRTLHNGTLNMTELFYSDTGDMATANVRKSSRTATANLERGRSAADKDASPIKPSYPIHRYRSTKAIPELSSAERQELKVSVYARYYPDISTFQSGLHRKTQAKLGPTPVICVL